MYWTVHLEGGPRRVNHAAVVVEDKIYSFGGYCTGDSYRRRRPMDIHVLNTCNFRWIALPVPKQNDPKSSCVPYQRYGHTAVAYGSNIFVWGGRNDEAACNVLFCFDTKTLQWSRPQVTGIIPAARDGHSACIINHCMYVFGGFEEEMDRFSQDVHALDFHTMRWSYIITQGEPPSYRDFHTATPLANRMYIFGGRGDLYGPYHSQEEIYSRDIMYLDTHTGMWHKPITHGDIPVGRRSHSAFAYKGHLYIFGGYNGLMDEHFNDLYRFSSVHNEWKLVKPLGKPPTKRRRQVCLVVGDKVFLFGGTSPSTVPDSSGIPVHVIDDDHQGLDAKLMDHSDLHVLDCAPSLYTLCLCVVLQHHLQESWLPDFIKCEIRAMTTNNSISRLLNHTG